MERAFGIPAQNLLDMQAAFDAARARAKGVPANVLPYVAPFLEIKAADVEAWVERNISARTRLAVLLRTLIHSTGSGLTKVDFPGNDDAQRPDWDGYLETNQATPWIPDGASGWEFGADKDIKPKADGDFAKAVRAMSKGERDLTSFVFVTPRHWPGKSRWLADKTGERQWKAVRAYDSSDLEQWLQQSIPAQAWFANEILKPSEGVRSLDKCWSDWASVAIPPLVGSLFAPAVEGAKRMLISRLSKSPEEPIVVAADSEEEALAFLAQLFGPAGGQDLEKFRDRVLVFGKPGVLPKLAQGNKDFIAVATKRDVERELGPFAAVMHTIVVYPRNAANVQPHIILEPLNYEAFRTSLESMGCKRDEVARYASESGRSLTVLRRRLSTMPAVRLPEWADDRDTSVRLIPFLFVGAWSSTNTADQTFLTLLAEADSYDEVEKECQRLAALNDAPLWSLDAYRGVVSKIDLLFAIAGSVTAKDLAGYFLLARMVLGEDDPKLDLPEDERWAASIKGKAREFSAVLREGVAETLVLIAVHGNHLFRTRLGFDCEVAVNQLVRDLLTPLKTRILEANDRDLAAYAEAAPDEFLSILDEDLKADKPETYGLMRPAGRGGFGSGCPRTGLLWALEGLAWNPATLPHTALILAQLAGIEIKDNWANSPLGSLNSIFRVWMPQTAADPDTRLQAIKLLAERFPAVAWKICLEQLNIGPKTGHYSHKPSWRNDGHGFGEPIGTQAPIVAFKREIADMVLVWKRGYTREMIGDLIERLYGLEGKHQTKVWELLRTWAGYASDADKAFVREKIRATLMSRQGVMRSKRFSLTSLSEAAKSAYELLEPSDIVNKHEWMFRNYWVQESADESEEKEIDLTKREARISKLRTAALREVFETRGLAGIFELAEKGKAASVIGSLMATEILREDELPGLVLAALGLASNDESWAKKNLVSGALGGDDKRRAVVLQKVKKELSEANFVRLVLLAPFRRSTWRIVDEMDVEYRRQYWDEVVPVWIGHADDENVEAVKRLLDATRPRAAFACVHFKLEALDPELLFRLLSDMAKEGKDKPGQYQIDHHDLENGFRLLDKSPHLTLEDKAILEFAYIEVLSEPWRADEAYGIPNLEKYVELHPELFVRAVVWTYNRKDEGEDSPEWKVAPDQVETLAKRGREFLDGLSRIPGHDDLGELQTERLAAWIKVVRQASAAVDRGDIADYCIGKLLSNAPVGGDGIWPCEAVREVMEEAHSKSMMEGASNGLYNSRGVVVRGEGGDQERALANKYRTWANAIQYAQPFVSSELLLQMVRTYEHQASRWDSEAAIRRRIR
jgi:hypothetical protein